MEKDPVHQRAQKPAPYTNAQALDQGSSGLPASYPVIWSHKLVGRYQYHDHCKLSACLVRSQPTHQQAYISPRTSWAWALPTNRPKPVLINLGPLSQLPWNPAPLTSGPATALRNLRTHSQLCQKSAPKQANTRHGNTGSTTPTPGPTAPPPVGHH